MTHLTEGSLTEVDSDLSTDVDEPSLPASEEPKKPSPALRESKRHSLRNSSLKRGSPSDSDDSVTKRLRKEVTTMKMMVDTETTTTRVVNASLDTATTVTTVATTTTTRSLSSAPPTHPFFNKRNAPSAAASTSSSDLTSGKLITWTKDYSVLVGTYQTQHSSTKIAAFDFDHTIAGVRGTHAHPKGGDDWSFVHSSIPNRIIELHQQGYRIVIMSNQKGIEENNPKCKARKSTFLGRIENAVKGLEAAMVKAGSAPVPLLVMGATVDDWFRKPRPGMWELLESKYNDGVTVDRSASFYVGDAAGRPQAWIAGHKKDHSDSDLKFALNVGCAFHTPETFFHPPAKVLKYPPVPQPSFNPREAVNQPNHSQTSQQLDLSIPKSIELILFVGSPASGKSSFAHRHLVPRGYVYVNQDTLKTREACLKATEAALKAGKSVVVDNTNPEAVIRKMYIALAGRVGGISVRCFWFKSEEALCLHNNAYRQHGQPRAKALDSGGGDEATLLAGNIDIPQPSHAYVPTMAFRFFAKKLQAPETSEGFAEVRQIEFTPNFASTLEGRYWQLYYT
ncbi:hypothetical protein HDV00_003832 [Rhizophlyctis rosea]|nr:hypothetical protein HDV00_003832 [Rhizophlyctis rosea]